MSNNCEKVSCGLDFAISSDLNKDLDSSLNSGFDFICVPLVHPRYERDFFHEKLKNRKGPLTRSDFLLSSNEWTSLIVGRITTSLKLDAKDEIVRSNAELAFQQEISLANHLNLPAILIELKSSDCANLARNINICANNAHCNLLWVRVPMMSPGSMLDDVFDETSEECMRFLEDCRKEDPWQWWNKMRTLCGFNKKLCIILEMTTDLPDEGVIERWLAEPVKAVLVSTRLFLTNRKGFPVLSRSHQVLLKRLFKLNAQLVLTGKNRHKDKGYASYKLYLDHLYQNRDSLDEVAQFARGYEDYLQCPLQPLMDNLESQTYEIFEKDPIKYTKYQLAVYGALLDKVKEEDKDKVTLTVMVLGAGRGPLVTASLQAASAADRRVRVYAVEKNPNAVVTLENLKSDTWGDKVTIISCDMRFWEPEEKADIIVSELLGSFGDNELSPECLDGAERLLKEDGISIPSSYTSYLAPLHSSKLWNEAKMCAEMGKPLDSQFETPYVVRLHNYCLISEPQPLFTFHHPRSAYDVQGGFVSNNRYGELKFQVSRDLVLHGFSGYFHCTLYKDVTISIVPDTHTPRMFSWFPIYLPIRNPQSLKAGEELVVNFWRINNGKNVWYEWCLSAPRASLIHNTAGRSYTIGL